MRILLISDVHANFTALKTVMDAAGNIDAVWCMGDLVGYGPDPDECISFLRTFPNLTCILGNHDAAILNRIKFSAFNNDAQLSLRWGKDHLSDSNLEFLKSLSEICFENNCLLTHGSPRNPIWEYILDSYIAKANFDMFFENICMVGHTHLPSVFFYQKENLSVISQSLYSGDVVEINDRTIFNPGSVGQPRDHDPRAAYAIYYPEERRIETFRIDYDIAGVQTRIRKSGLPEQHALRLSGGY